MFIVFVFMFTDICVTQKDRGQSFQPCVRSNQHSNSAVSDDVNLLSAFVTRFSIDASPFRCADHSYSSQLYVTSHDNLLYDAEESVDLTTEEEDEEAITQAVAERYFFILL